MTETNWYPVATAADIPEGRMHGCVVGGRDVVVCHTREGWFAVDNICSHAYARMDEGRLRGCRLICPLHGASFDVRTGAVLGLPANTPLATFPVRIVGDTVEVAVGS